MNSRVSGINQPYSFSPERASRFYVSTMLLTGMRVELQSLKIVAGGEYLLTMNIVNQSTTKPFWVAINHGPWSIKASLFDPQGSEFITDVSNMSGITVGQRPSLPLNTPEDSFITPVQVSPNNSTTATIRFYSRDVKATPGLCRLQVEFLLSYQFRYNYAYAPSHENLVISLQAN